MPLFRDEDRMLLQLQSHPERGCMRLFARGHLFWKVRGDALQYALAMLSCRCWFFPRTVWNLGWFGYLLAVLWTVRSVDKRMGLLCVLQNLSRKTPNTEWLPKILAWLENEKNPNLIWELSDNNYLQCSAWKLWRELDALFLKEIVMWIINFACFFYCWTNIKYLFLLWGRSLGGGKILSPKAASTSHQTWLC